MTTTLAPPTVTDRDRRRAALAFPALAPGRYLAVARPFVVESGERAPRPAALDAKTRALLRREAESANTTVELKPCQRTADFVLRFPPPATPAAK